jgi:hypothetical protein
MTFVLWEIPGHDKVLGGVGLRTKGYALFILDHRGDTVNRRFRKNRLFGWRLQHGGRMSADAIRTSRFTWHKRDITISQCVDCCHKHTTGAICTVFPEGIPETMSLQCA